MTDCVAGSCCRQVDISRAKPKEKEAALKEVKLLASFDHPNIIKYRESFVDTGILHIVMDFAEGGDLHALLKHQQQRLLPEAQVIAGCGHTCMCAMLRSARSGSTMLHQPQPSPLAYPYPRSLTTLSSSASQCSMCTSERCCIATSSLRTYS